MTTRPGQLSTEEAQKIANAVDKKGTKEDARVTVILKWIAGVVSALVVLLLADVSSTMAQMGKDIAVIKSAEEHKSLEITKIDGQIVQLQAIASAFDHRLTMLEAIGADQFDIKTRVQLLDNHVSKLTNKIDVAEAIKEHSHGR